MARPPLLDDAETRSDGRMPAVTRPAPTRRRRGAGQQSAGQLLVVMVTALVLAALVNADAMVERAERKPFGPGRDRSLTLWHPVQDIAHVTQLSRLRTLGDLLVGNDDRPTSDDLTASVPEDPPAPPPDAEVRPELRVPTSADPLRIYIAGDSVVRDAGESFLRLAADDPRLASTLHYEIATGLSRPDFYDWPTALADDVEALKPDVAVIMFGGNDAQGIVGPDGTVFPTVDAPGWREEYGRRVAAVMDELQDPHRLVFWVGQPPMRDAAFDRRIGIINDVVATEAADRPWVTFVDTAEVLGGPDGGYAARLPGTDADLRQADGIHLSRAGADLLARQLLTRVQDEVVAAGKDAADGATDATSAEPG